MEVTPRSGSGLNWGEGSLWLVGGGIEEGVTVVVVVEMVIAIIVIIVVIVTVATIIIVAEIILIIVLTALQSYCNNAFYTVLSTTCKVYSGQSDCPGLKGLKDLESVSPKKTHSTKTVQL